MADENGTSIKVAKYSGTDRVNLIENNEFGFCSLVKTAKQMLDKLDIENRTTTQITSKERVELRLWDAVALREAVINAIVHNDYTREIPPKFEIFSDRLEITSAGGLPEGMDKEEFFEGFSIPRNKEIMRIFKDLEMVEHLGSGIPRILEAYKEESFIFTENFLHMSFPNFWSLEDAAPQETDQVTDQVKKLITYFESKDLSLSDIMLHMNMKHRNTFRQNYLYPAINLFLLEMTIPNKPNSRFQKYRLTEKGKQLKATLLKKK